MNSPCRTLPCRDFPCPTLPCRTLPCPHLAMPHLAMPHLAMPGQPMPIKSYNPNPKNFRQHQMPCTHAAPCHAAPCHAAHSHAGAGHAATCHAAGMPKTTICPTRFTPTYINSCHFSITALGFILYLLWEAMLISYLGQRNIILPFDGVESLMMKSDFGIAVAPGTAQEESFKNSKVPLWQKAERECWYENFIRGNNRNL